MDRYRRQHISQLDRFSLIPRPKPAVHVKHACGAKLVERKISKGLFHPVYAVLRTHQIDQAQLQ